MTNFPNLLDCPECADERLQRRTSGNYSCPRCAHTVTPEKAADLCVSKVLKIGVPKGGEDRKIVFECPDCGDQTLVDLGEDAIPAVRYMCFGCEKTWREGEIRECIEGPHFFKPDERDPIPICKACFAKKIASDQT